MSEPTTEAERNSILATVPWYDESNPDYTELDKAIATIKDKARADAPDVDALALAHYRVVNSLKFDEHERPFWEAVATEYRAILAARKQDAATDEAEKQWVKPLPKPDWHEDLDR